MNMAECVLGAHQDPARVALRVVDANGAARALRYGDLASLAHRFAHALAHIGIGKGDVLGVLCPRGAEAHVTVLGGLLAGAVVMPLFASFGPQPVATRMALARARALVTTRRLFEHSVLPQRAAMPALENIVLVDGPGSNGCSACSNLADMLRCEPDQAYEPVTRAGDPALLHFTSGTGGRPKGVLHVHDAVRSHLATAREALQLGAGDVFWCTADMGWVTGMSYGVMAALGCGTTSVVSPDGFDAALWYRILDEQAVNVWYTSPTALRMLARSALPVPRLPALRRIASVGEALDAACVEWTRRNFGVPVCNTWWQTETGAIMIADAVAPGRHPGAMGKPLTGVDARIVRRLGGRRIGVVDTQVAEGELAFAAGWPSMFHGYLEDESRYRAQFAHGLYLSGDIVRRDEAGQYWFVGRRDDMIKTAGHLVGPAEVERVLTQHEAVAEAGVVGKPDAVAGEIVVACVVLKRGRIATPALRDELLAHARRALGPVLAPRQIEFLSGLPHNEAGKILRRQLKRRCTRVPVREPAESV
ncbi:MAG: AMP-binding protein [Rhodocyclaceae bacterium]|nr:AMP-binding protein [Rhodocyclaceae bacterium]